MKWFKLAGLLLLALLLVVFALMGYLSATRGTPTRAVLAIGHADGPPPINDSLFTNSIELLTKTDLSGGHHIEPLFDGDGTFPRLWQDIRAAQHTLFLQLYYCKPGVIADSLKHALLASAARGVRAFVLFDAFGASSLSEAYLDSLRTAGIRVAEFRPVKWYTLHKAQNRSHVRAVVVDGTVGYTGGFGIDDAWLGDGHSPQQWRETNVRLTGPAVHQLQAAFATAWAEATGELLTGAVLQRPAVSVVNGVAQAGLLHAEPDLGSTAAERFLVLTIASARRRLYITNAYFIPDEDLRQLLVEAAQRGVDVRVLTAGKTTDVKAARLAARRHYSQLLRGGVRIYEYQPTMVHAKTIVADDVWSTIGTMNFDNRSLAFNEESNLLVADSAVAGILTAKFEDDLRFSREIVLRDFARRSVFSKLLERAAGAVAPLL
ncbi:MAG TPA: phospholipase D-like domain-containing protein [Longimicrobiales bacterium]|nr:phospholipase D-like domain-containing protein [Longimicrobiales bacterium]